MERLTKSVYREPAKMIALEGPYMQSQKRIKSLREKGKRSYDRVKSPFRSNCTP